ncbi:MAG: GNAT family N-acetyltransferase, partial [Candidatus Levybacteria bacterium]|nr:GNAT family N-acetyltransferase [Candidatus Levybacteria bacterium]
ICTHPDWRQKRIATKIAFQAISFLKQNGCDIGFLSVNPNDEKSIRLHQKYGFVMLPQNFSWTNSKGEIKQDTGGMISLLGSKELFEFVLNNSEPFYVGNGYW